MPDIEMTDNPAQRRWELLADGELAVYLTYRDRGSRRTFVHTETQDGYEGKGLASQLVRVALDDARTRGLEIDPVCPFVRGWLDRHPEYGVSSGPERPSGGEHAGDEG